MWVFLLLFFFFIYCFHYLFVFLFGVVVFLFFWGVCMIFIFLRHSQNSIWSFFVVFFVFFWGGGCMIVFLSRHLRIQRVIRMFAWLTRADSLTSWSRSISACFSRSLITMASCFCICSSCATSLSILARRSWNQSRNEWMNMELLVSNSCKTKLSLIWS